LTEFNCLLGAPAFSEFQRQKLVDGLRRRVGQEFSFTAQFIYFAESPASLAADKLSRLEALLQAESAAAAPTGNTITLVYQGYRYCTPLWSGFDQSN